MDKQKTIAKEVSISGVGLHTGNKANVIFKPAEIDSGINFVRSDLPGKPLIKCVVDHFIPSSAPARRTSVGENGAEIHTVEHLMAALSGSGVNNIIIDIDNNEIPGLDGSSANFLELFQKAGIKEQDKEEQHFSIKEPILVEEAGASIIALPSSDFKISYTLSYNHPLLKVGFLEVSINPDVFKKEIARARTFCLENEANELLNQGFGKGANYDNTLVVGEKGVIKNKLRFDDEFVRHKILDLMGDLYLLGHPIKGHIVALRSGHSLNIKLVKKINEQYKRYMVAGIGSDYTVKEEQSLDINEIMKILPHREPFLFVDRIIRLEKGKRATGIKNVTMNDYFFKGHFPGRPVMPGVIIVEAMAQVGGVMMLSPEENRGKLAFFMAINNVKFRKTVVPGDQLVFEVEAVKIKSKTGLLHGKAFVDGKIVAEADLMFALADS